MTPSEAYALRPGTDLVRRLEQVGDVVCVRKSTVDVQWLRADSTPDGELESVDFVALERVT